MKLIVKFFLFLFAASILMTVVFFLRISPSIKIWENYKVLYFPTEYKNTEIIDAIGNTDFLNQIIFEDPEYHHAWNNRMMPGSEPVTVRGFSYNDLRDFFFYDKSGSFKIIYVPDDISKAVINSLNKSGITFGTDSVTHYPYLYPIVCFVVIILLTIFGKISFLRLICAIPLVLFALWCPFYSSAAGAVCILFAFYAAEQYTGKKYGIKSTLLNPVVILCTAFSFLSVAIGGVKLLLLFSAAVLSCILLYVSVKYAEMIYDSTCHFHFMPILTSKNIGKFKRVTIRSVSTGAAVAVVLTVFFFMSSGIIRSIGDDGLYLPSPSEYTETEGINSVSYTALKELRDIENYENQYPDAADFIDEYWLNIRSQYIRLFETDVSTEVSVGDVISIPSFMESDGGIKAEQRIIETFDDSFLDKVSEAFIQNGGAEKFIASNEKLFATTYKKAGDTSHDMNSMLSIISLFVLFVILLTLRLIKGCKK